MSATARKLSFDSAERSAVVSPLLGGGELESLRTGIEAAIAFWSRESEVSRAEFRFWSLKYRHAQATAEELGIKRGPDMTHYEHCIDMAREDYRIAEREIEKLRAEWFETVREP